MPSSLLSGLTHPTYRLCFADWCKWRAVYRGGECFLDDYLEKFSDRESASDFARRKKLSPIPGFAASAIVDIRNGLGARLGKVTRAGGPASYQSALKGQLGGVDRKGASMSYFLKECVLDELLPIGKVGVFVDRPPLPERPSLLDSGRAPPYLYYYRAEEILNWSWKLHNGQTELDMVLLKECHYQKDDVYGLCCGEIELYRLVELVDSASGPYVQVRFFRQVTDPSTHTLVDVQVDQNGLPTSEARIINLPVIPFHVFEIDSLLKWVANHQIALLNMESSDIAYNLDANFPIYTEEFNRATMPSHIKDESTGEVGGEKVVDIGIKRGRLYAAGLQRPGFIHPSSEPIVASMEKQKNLKDDVRTLVNLALSNVRVKFASAESKEFDEHGLESGLASIGETLEYGEHRIAQFWAMYEDSTSATIIYPERYSLPSGEERRKNADQLAETKKVVPSLTFRKEMDKRIAVVLLEDQVADEVMTKVLAEIDQSTYPTADPVEIRSDMEAGLVTAETASLARGWPKGEAEKAGEEKAERLAQSQALNVGSNSDGAMARLDEKAMSQSPDTNLEGEKLVRGEGQ